MIAIGLEDNLKVWEAFVTDPAITDMMNDGRSRYSAAVRLAKLYGAEIVLANNCVITHLSFKNTEQCTAFLLKYG